MKILKELEISKVLKKSDEPEDVAAILSKKYRIKVLGVGGQGVVFDIGNNQVLKLFYKADICYIRFVRMVLQNPSPYFPKYFEGIRKVKGFDWYGIKMEKLQPISFSFLKKYENFLALMLSEPKLSDSAVISEYFSSGRGLDSVDDREQILQEYMIDITPEQARIVDLLSQVSGGCNIDIHHENVMRRGNQLVITDPYYPDY